MYDVFSGKNRQLSGVVVVRCGGSDDRCDVLNTNQTPKEMIDSFRDASNQRFGYTVARTVAGGDRVVEYESHVKRLQDTCERLKLDSSGSSMHISNHAQQSDRHDHRKKPDKNRLYRCTSFALRAFSDLYPDEDGERRLTLLCAAGTEPDRWHDVGDDDDEVYCHVERLPPPPTRPIVVEVRGEPRKNPKAKDADWIDARKSLKSSDPNDVHEVLLAKTSTCATTGTISAEICEGTETNVFAVIDGVVRTAGEGILEGTVRRIVLEQCEALGVPVCLEPPRVEELAAWDAAFLTSTSRLVLPIDEIRVDPESFAAKAIAPHSRGRRTFEASHSLVEKISMKVECALLASSRDCSSPGISPLPHPN